VTLSAADIQQLGLQPKLDVKYANNEAYDMGHVVNGGVGNVPATDVKVPTTITYTGNNARGNGLVINGGADGQTIAAILNSRNRSGT
jgi:hypothetical protein